MKALIKTVSFLKSCVLTPNIHTSKNTSPTHRLLNQYDNLLSWFRNELMYTSTGKVFVTVKITDQSRPGHNRSVYFDRLN